MTARVERRFSVQGTVADVWEFIADPANRARAISVVEHFEQRGDTTIWHIRLPIPFIRKTFPVKTRDVEREPPEFVRFKGTSSTFNVEGEHRIEGTDSGATINNVFVVEGRAPGVEGFFRRNLDGEITNLERALKSHLATT